MIVARCCAGVFAGCLVTVRAMLSENSTKHTQARAFSYFAFAGNLGLFIGPILGRYLHQHLRVKANKAIGGVLERPAEKYTSTFGRVQFFHDYPYALPSMVTSAIALSAALTTQLFVKEVSSYNDRREESTNPGRRSMSIATPRRPTNLPCRPGSSSTTLASPE
jgi:MFS family permease